METSNDSSEAVNIHQDLLAILCCPETKQELSLLDTPQINHLNQKIEQGDLKNHGGALVKEKLQGGLLRKDKLVVYPIREDIPSLLIEEGILVEGLF